MKGPRRSLKIVIKLGTSSIVDETTHEPILSNLTLIVETVAKLQREGHEVVIVSSGAVGVGLRRMNVDKRPTSLSKLQALAAVGQCQLIALWDSLFAHLRIPIAQILMTRNDIVDRTQYVNAQNTLSELLSMGIVPIVNENDTIAVSEIKFGDNDTLSAVTAAMVEADYLFLMTDVDGLYTANPRTDPLAQVIDVVPDISCLTADVSSAGSALGTGGMGSKIVAARLATSAGVTTVITRSSRPGNVDDILEYIESLDSTASDDGHASDEGRSTPPLHTRFLASEYPMESRSFWLLHGLAPHGTIYIDEGAYQAILTKNSLLPAGVIDVKGHFGHLEAVSIVVTSRRDYPGELNGDFPHQGSEKEVGRALVNYGSPELSRIKGLRSSQIQSVLGYAESEYVALRENIAFFDEASRMGSPEAD
ncbi:hypothetical protein FQN57_002772 [Myotisia sp. PD_48]|nr:hypothetical protein FQN57_002772 [Myotisia sp. PD_48]